MDALASLQFPASCPHTYHLISFPSNESDASATETTSTGLNHVILQHYNHTGRLQNRTISSGQNHITAAMAGFLVLSIFIILENLLVLLAVISRIRHSRRWVYVCIANITLSDLLTGAAFVVNICLSGSRSFSLSTSLWLFREGMLFVALAASIFSLLLIAMERYSAMIKPLSHKSPIKSYYRMFFLVVLCWVFALVIGLLPLLGWNCVCSLDTCSTILPLYSKSYILFSLIIFFLILITIAVLYSAIYCHVRKSTQMGPQRTRRRSLALLKTVVCIVAVFMLCWGPLFILLLVDFFCISHDCMLLFSADYFISLAVLNSALNPIIYALGSSDMRKAMTQLLCSCCVKSRICHLDTFTSRESSSTSGSRRDSLHNSFNKIKKLSVASPPSTPSKPHKVPKKYRLSSTTSCLSVSSS